MSTDAESILPYFAVLPDIDLLQMMAAGIFLAEEMPKEECPPNLRHVLTVVAECCFLEMRRRGIGTDPKGMVA